MNNIQKDKQLILNCLSCQKVPKIQLTHYKFPEVYYNCEYCKDKRTFYLNSFLQKINIIKNIHTVQKKSIKIYSVQYFVFIARNGFVMIV